MRIIANSVQLQWKRPGFLLKGGVGDFLAYAEELVCHGTTHLSLNAPGYERAMERRGPQEIMLYSPVSSARLRMHSIRGRWRDYGDAIEAQFYERHSAALARGGEPQSRVLTYAARVPFANNTVPIATRFQFWMENSRFSASPFLIDFDDEKLTRLIETHAFRRVISGATMAFVLTTVPDDVLGEFVALINPDKFMLLEDNYKELGNIPEWHIRGGILPTCPIWPLGLSLHLHVKQVIAVNAYACELEVRVPFHRQPDIYDAQIEAMLVSIVRYIHGNLVHSQS